MDGHHTYKVTAAREGGWWTLEAPEIPGVFSQARHLDQAEAMARDAIALMLQVPGDSFGVVVEAQLPPPPGEHWLSQIVNREPWQ